jgi:ATP-dependent RNA helicase DeaD
MDVLLCIFAVHLKIDIVNPFQQLGLSENIVNVLEQLGFTQPTPIQEQAIPLLLQNDPTDFIGLAQTGTGKTAAFGLPLIELIDDQTKETQVLIMAPTRELGQQTAQQLTIFSRNIRDLNIEVVYGGAAISNQIKALRKPTQIVVATPGRLLDLIKRKAIKLANVRYVVLDEADEMLNMGFKEDIDEILSFTSEDRVTWLFSATMPPEIRRIVKKYMNNPREVSVNAQDRINRDIKHTYVVTKTSDKLMALQRFLDLAPDLKGVLFCRTKRETQQIADALSNAGYGAEALHGDLSQAQRDAVMNRFKRHSLQLLVATDVAARGIDVNDLTHVFHHTLPDQLESYTHRSGRTGRAGNKGISMAFINGRENRKIKDLERANKITFEKVEVPQVEDLRSTRIDHWASIIINTNPDSQSAEILEKVRDRFSHLSKDELLIRLITTQLDHLTVQDDRDLNEDVGTRSSKSGKEEQSNANRYFINVGTMDGLTKGDLLHFLSDIGQVDKDKIGRIDLHKSFSFFELDKSLDAGFTDKFEGLEVEGRALRVNRDDQPSEKRSSGSKRQGKSKSYTKRKQRYK